MLKLSNAKYSHQTITGFFWKILLLDQSYKTSPNRCNVIMDYMADQHNKTPQDLIHHGDVDYNC